MRAKLSPIDDPFSNKNNGGFGKHGRTVNDPNNWNFKKTRNSNKN